MYVAKLCIGLYACSYLPPFPSSVTSLLSAACSPSSSTTTASTCRILLKPYSFSTWTPI